jgi:hypothetical protein
MRNANTHVIYDVTRTIKLTSVPFLDDSVHRAQRNSNHHRYLQPGKLADLLLYRCAGANCVVTIKQRQVRFVN